jgi:outer membrane protein TolC
MRAALLLVCLLISPALGAQVPEILELMPSDQVRPLLEQDPSVKAARAALEAARREGQMLELSPYDWTARASTQRRTVRSADRYQEWNIGVERTLRLPAKAEADRKTASVAVELAAAQYGEALHEAAKSFLTGYLDWLAAEHAVELAEANRKAAGENLAAAERRVRVGDASKLDRSLAQADASEQDRLANDARTLANASWARLHARYAGMPRQPHMLPPPLPIGPETAYWRERIVAQSDTLKVAEAEVRKSQAQTDRGRAERTPDPTVGGFTASEFGGAERLIGIYVSVPFSGERRSLNAERGEYLAETARHQAERTKRELEADIAASVANAAGAYESWKIAGSAVLAAQENAKLMQRAYSLGEADLHALLLARRQATGAAQGALSSRAAALKAYSLLLIDAHLIWGLEHD